MSKKTEKSILLIMPRYIAKSALYSLVIQDGYFYFCKIGSRFWANEDQMRKFHSGMSEEELLHSKGSFKIPAESVESIRLETKRSPWTAAVDNHGTVIFETDQKILRFILCGQTPMEILTERLETGGFHRYTLTDNAVPDDLVQQGNTKENRNVIKMLTPIAHALCGLAVFLAIWLFFLPYSTPYAAGISLILPPASAVLCWKYRSLLTGNSAKSSGKGTAVFSFLMIPVLILPMLLTLWVMINLNVLYNWFVLPGLILFTVLCVALLLFRYEHFRSKAWVITLALMIFSYVYSGLLVTNCLFYSCPTAQYSAIIEDKYTHHNYRSTTYYLQLSPWGKNPDKNTVSVGIPLYAEALPGKVLSITQERGIWGIEWYQLSFID